MKLRILACLFAVVFAAFAFGSSRFAHAQQRESEKAPPAELVERFDKLIQTRFLAKPNFGFRRIQPIEPVSAHLEYFSPDNADERSIVDEFEKKGWKVAIYLYGRSVEPFKNDSKYAGKFDIKYKVNVPVPVAKRLRSTEVPTSKSLLGQVKTAFVDFQTRGAATENAYDFKRGGWNYYARPIRASETSCLACHQDYVITQRLGDGKFKFRKRELGDANGVVVYAFRRK